MLKNTTAMRPIPIFCCLIILTYAFYYIFSLFLCVFDTRIVCLVLVLDITISEPRVTLIMYALAKMGVMKVTCNTFSTKNLVPIVPINEMREEFGLMATNFFKIFILGFCLVKSGTKILFKAS